MFYSFATQEERRAFGGSDFLELQFCRIPPGTDIEVLVAVDSIMHWLNDSLYVSGDDMNAFWEIYSPIFTGGVYNNQETGPVDLYGINYYSPELTETIAARLRREKPSGCGKLLEWLTQAKQYNGFYILGV